MAAISTKDLHDDIQVASKVFRYEDVVLSLHSYYVEQILGTAKNLKVNSGVTTQA